MQSSCCARYLIFGHTIFKWLSFLHLYSICIENSMWLRACWEIVVWSFVEFCWVVLKLRPTKSCAIFFAPPDIYEWEKSLGKRTECLDWVLKFWLSTTNEKDMLRSVASRFHVLCHFFFRRYIWKRSSQIQHDEYVGIWGGASQRHCKDNSVFGNTWTKAKT